MREGEWRGAGDGPELGSDGFERDREVSARDGEGRKKKKAQGWRRRPGNEKRQPGSICPSAIPRESTPRSALGDSDC